VLALVNPHPIQPITVALGVFAYRRTEIESYLLQLPFSVSLVDAFTAAVTAVMLGALCATERLPFDRRSLLKVLLEHVPQRTRTVNERAFELGAGLIVSGA
jgi:Pyruvate/2-oxoacid:ferredoxin oxidoreductase gamma subunit